MSADVMLTCFFRFETYGGLHGDKCFQIGRTGCLDSKSNDAFCQWLWEEIDDKSEKYLRKIWDRGKHRLPEGESSTTSGGGYAVKVDVMYQRLLDDKFINAIIKKHNAVLTRFATKKSLVKWLKEHRDEYISIEYW